MKNENNIRQRLSERLKFSKYTVTPPFPKNMLVELSNLCNHKCFFCANQKMTRKIGTMNEKLLYKILNEAFDLGTREVGFYTVGEPFISKNLSEYVYEAKKIGYEYVYITTNGTLATPERSKSVIEAGIDSIKFSINAGTKETYRRIHGKDDFDRVIENLKFISNYREINKKKFKIYVSFVVTKQNQNEKTIVEQFFGDMVDDIIFSNVRNQVGYMNEEMKFLSVGKNEYEINSPPCPLPFESLYVTYEGYLTICCSDIQNYLTVADLNINSLHDAWFSDKFQEIREKHLEDNLNGTLCYNCLFYKNEEIKPLTPKHAEYFDKDSFNVSEEILKRMEQK